MEKLLHFFIENTPPLKTILIGGPICLLWSYLCLSLAGYLKTVKQIKTGYTRKTFHLMTFTTAAVLHVTLGLPLVCLFGGMTTLVLAYALVRGAGHPLYEAIAREKDEPYRTYYIIVPYIATLIGGLVSNMLFGPVSIIGYLVGGLGDAAGEPVGTRWGKHKYVVPTLSKVKTTRSFEGSLGVLIVSLIAILIGIALLPYLQFNFAMLKTVLLMGLICALLEAVSPHGWDNATMQIAPAWLAFLLLQ